jgi:MYXO-CTERM domain-containing protein
MKNILFLLFLVPGYWSLGELKAQSAEQGILEESFKGMFQQEPNLDWLDIQTNNNPPPPVPVDGGLVALLAAGGAVGYRRYRRYKKKL